MPDAPDYSKYLPNSIHYSLQDLSELAARIGSVDVYDRRGEVVVIDDITHGLSGWGKSGTGLNWAANIVVDPVYHSPFALQLIADAAPGSLTQVFKYYDQVIAAKTGLEIGICFTVEFDYFQMYIVHDNLIRKQNAVLKIDNTNKQISVMDDSLTFKVIDAITPPVFAYGKFHDVKLVADFSSGYYMRLLYDEHQYDLSKYKLAVGGTPSDEHMETLFTLASNGSNAGFAYMGHMIVTSNEP